MCDVMVRIPKCNVRPPSYIKNRCVACGGYEMFPYGSPRHEQICDHCSNTLTVKEMVRISNQVIKRNEMYNCRTNGRSKK